MSGSATPTQQPKRKKVRTANRSKLILDLPPECRLSKLPVELLAEILLYTESPRDVLSVARSCKALCYTLLYETNQFIWRYCRMNCKPEPLPEPVPRFTESAYAAFVFDKSDCEVCGQPASLSGSYALELKICRKPECQTALTSAPRPILTSDFLHVSELHRDRPYFSTLPSAESSRCFDANTPKDTSVVAVWPQIEKMRISDLTRAYHEYLDESSTPEKLEAYVQRCEKRTRQNREFMALCVSLYHWRCNFETLARNVKKENEKIGKSLAKRHGIDYWDLISTPSYGEVYRAKNKALEKITDFDYGVRREAINAQLLKIKEQRARRTHEDNYRKARGSVAKHYNRLRFGKQETPLPTLERFRELPIITQLQKNARSDLDLDAELQSPLISSLLNTQLEEWRTKTMDHLGTLVGQPAGWKSASTQVLHPVQRVTARFKCGRCKRLEMSYQEDECFDLAGVCAHQCKPEKKDRVLHWNVEKFTTDEKAINAMTKVVKLCNIHPESSSSISALKGMGCRILCMSCEPLIVMSPESVVGHCHRHDDMEMRLITKEEAEAIMKDRPPVKLAQRLLGNEKRFQAARKLMVFGCRHCAQRKGETGSDEGTANTDTTTVSTIAPTDATNGSTATPTDATGGLTTATTNDNPPPTNGGTKANNTTNSASDPGDNVGGDGEKAGESSESKGEEAITPAMKPRKLSQMFSFDGLRSHLKAKHAVLNIRDEDLHCTRVDEVLKISRLLQ
ncbi:hypothetical protein E1B28_009052 [Marasmius oreades]|uniref:F-box domain-containing protein n=1 Tax=Marasmius oreades TaxID=181124 RepID=A0A9P7S077_9AGAR|nr:uncharacterized protein E1B28_009052 [Marasmius oreades]KAG7092723.1 hypothetical protein E1B28_009052 [Marasmius oreades]